MLDLISRIVLALDLLLLQPSGSRQVYESVGSMALCVFYNAASSGRPQNVDWPNPVQTYDARVLVVYGAIFGFQCPSIEERKN